MKPLWNDFNKSLSPLWNKKSCKDKILLNLARLNWYRKIYRSSYSTKSQLRVFFFFLTSHWLSSSMSHDLFIDNWENSGCEYPDEKVIHEKRNFSCLSSTFQLSDTNQIVLCIVMNFISKKRFHYGLYSSFICIWNI